MLCTDLYFFAFQTLKSQGAEDERVQERRRPQRRILSGKIEIHSMPHRI